MNCDPVAPQDLFACRFCGQCCKGYGGTYVSESEIDAICRYLDLGRRCFVQRYCQISGGRPLIIQAQNGYCIFWNQLCSIHPVKPQMCRKWPFIDSVLVDALNWRSMAASCPGMRTDFSDQQIQQCVREMVKKSP